MRVFSFAQESTRYCNYAADKFNNEVTFIQPCWFKHDLTDRDIKFPLEIIAATPKDNYATGEEEFMEYLLVSENTYMKLLNQGWTPQQARTVLPNALKTELVMTGFISDWKHFFDLRCDTAAHPQARELAIPLKEEFIQRGYMH